MTKSTEKCRKDCDIYEAWRKLESQNADLVAELEDYKEAEIRICACGRIMRCEDDYDMLLSDSGLCCPICGNEEFQTIEQLLADNKLMNDRLSELADQSMQDMGFKKVPKGSK